MTPSPQLIIVETLFPGSGLKRVSYVLVEPKPEVAPRGAVEEDAAAFMLGVGRTPSVGDAAAIYILSKHDDAEPAFHSIRNGVLLEADDVMKREPDEETELARMWLVAEV
jgi:hypothetical protein